MHPMTVLALGAVGDQLLEHIAAVDPAMRVVAARGIKVNLLFPSYCALRGALPPFNALQLQALHQRRKRAQEDAYPEAAPSVVASSHSAKQKGEQPYENRRSFAALLSCAPAPVRKPMKNTHNSHAPYEERKSDMTNVIVKENHLTYGGVAYFRGHAEEVEIGSIGEKRQPLTKQNYLEVKDRIPVDKINGVKSTVVEIDATKLSKTDFMTKVAAIVPIGGVPVPIKFEGDVAFAKLKSRELKLVKFSVMNNDMMKAANNSPQKLQYLIDWENDARIAHQVFIVMDAKLSTKFDNNVNVTLSMGVDKLVKATVGGGGSASGDTTVQMSPGSGFAYLLAKIDWDAKQKKNKTKIIDLDDDQWSFS
jgi:hypothetical protein